MQNSRLLLASWMMDASDDGYELNYDCQCNLKKMEILFQIYGFSLFIILDTEKEKFISIADEREMVYGYLTIRKSGNNPDV